MRSEPDLSSLTQAELGLWLALRIHSDGVPPGEWVARVEAMPSEEARVEARRYLAGVGARLREQRRLYAFVGVTSEAEFGVLRRDARAARAPSVEAWHRAGRPQNFRGG